MQQKRYKFEKFNQKIKFINEKNIMDKIKNITNFFQRSSSLENEENKNKNLIYKSNSEKNISERKINSLKNNSNSIKNIPIGKKVSIDDSKEFITNIKMASHRNNIKKHVNTSKNTESTKKYNELQSTLDDIGMDMNLQDLLKSVEISTPKQKSKSNNNIETNQFTDLLKMVDEIESPGKISGKPSKEKLNDRVQIREAYTKYLDSLSISDLNTESNGSKELQAINLSSKVIDFLYDDKDIDDPTLEKLNSCKENIPTELQKKLIDKFSSTIQNDQEIDFDKKISMQIFLGI